MTTHFTWAIPPLMVGAFLVARALMVSSDTLAGSSLRTVEVDNESVTLIRTALGYSTILEFQSRPMSAVLGDQDSFRLEYVGNSITIKPLVPRAQSNLFIFTESERFNCQLVTVAPGQVDYLVRIRAKIKAYPLETGVPGNHKAGKKPEGVTTQVGRATSYDGYTLKVLSVTRERGPARPRAVTLIDFELSSAHNQYRFRTESLGVKQGQRFLTVESLSVDQVDLVPGAPPTHGRFALLAQDFDSSRPLLVVFAVPGIAQKPKPHRAPHPREPHRIEVKVFPPPRIVKVPSTSSTLVGRELDTLIGKPHEKGK